jgi:hypothetical protein
MSTRPESASHLVRTTAIEIEHDLIVRLRPEAAARETTVQNLVRELLDVIASDKLTAAILDDGAK